MKYRRLRVISFCSVALNGKYRRDMAGLIVRMGINDGDGNCERFHAQGTPRLSDETRIMNNEEDDLAENDN